MVSEVPGGVSVGRIFAKSAFLWETVQPSILNDSTSFWLDFAGSRLPETSKSEEKLRLEISVFFNTEKKCRRPVFPDFGVHFDVSFGARGCKKM